MSQNNWCKIFYANSGFWQMKLVKVSAKLTTFITSFGCFCFHWLPFGIASAPEHFQRQMSGGLWGVVCFVGSILVYRKMQEEHDQQLKAVLKHLSKVDLTLSTGKCEFSKRHIKFLVQLVDDTGVKLDSDKVHAIRAMKPPSNVSELPWFLEMIKQLSKLSLCLADKTKPLCVLLSSKNQWVRGHCQEEAFKAI